MKLWELSISAGLCVIACLGYMHCVPDVILGLSLIALGFSSFMHYRRICKAAINAKGIFSIVWLSSLGISCMKLHSVQIDWNYETWGCIIFAYMCFMIGFGSEHIAPNQQDWKQFENIDAKAASTVIWFGILVIVAFVCDCLYSQSIPILSRSMNSYQEFGMPLVHYITVFGALYPSIALYTIWRIPRNNENKNTRFVLHFLMLSSAIIPIIDVSRMQLMMELIALFVVWYFIIWNGKRIAKKTVFIVCLVSISGWLILSYFRNQDAIYLRQVFLLDSSVSDLEVSLWQLYLYIGGNFDNFNLLVDGKQGYTYGYSSLIGILALFRLDDLLASNVIDSFHMFRILPTYNTYSILQQPYNDFGLIGVVIYMLIIGRVSSIVEKETFEKRSLIWITLYNLIIYSLSMSFFFSMFSHRTFVATLLILLLLYTFLASSKRKRSYRQYVC